jgi:coproporphyrinogen III oxidase
MIKKLSTYRFSIKFLSKIFSIHDLIKIIYYKFSNAEYFEFKGKILKYFYLSYNIHRLTERAIEIPIIRYYFERIGKRACLEIRNVTNHYYSYFLDLIDLKTVIDKYEKGYGE